ncbi:MAG: peptidyl-prolyl cis-trans isomerase [Gammaproteobacteria bacterium]|nr:peptidyl-prolyl cis-trans isomerase [Gammaproteobacteria bacterium]MBU1415293.1 peptidyl-prolyl cis-trans isomerase [Gammaproteobacteria bacterium]
MKKLLAILAALALSLPAWAANPTVEMKTTLGTITIELYPDKAPKTVANFLQYVKDGFYDGTVFHRVIDGFMIQGGGMDLGLKEKPTRASIPNEAKNGLKNQIGTIAMARKPDPHSASAQFFINLVNNSGLDYPAHDGWGYCVFGKVTQGMDVVNKISKVATGRVSYYQDVPVKPVLIESVKLIETK